MKKIFSFMLFAGLMMFAAPAFAQDEPENDSTEVTAMVTINQDSMCISEDSTVYVMFTITRTEDVVECSYALDSAEISPLADNVDIVTFENLERNTEYVLTVIYGYVAETDSTQAKDGEDDGDDEEETTLTYDTINYHFLTPDYGNVGVTYIEQWNKMKLYPNPCSTDLTIEVNGTITKVLIYDILGHTVLYGEGNKVNVSNLKNGNYIVQVQTTTGIYTSKIVKK